MIGSDGEGECDRGMGEKIGAGNAGRGISLTRE
jgi:hypothetical protein